MLRTFMLNRPRVPTSSPLELTPHTGQMGVSVASGGVMGTPSASKVRARQRLQIDVLACREALEFADLQLDLPVASTPLR
jgi:hypothetical protein